jgi:hypothetical protein
VLTKERKPKKKGRKKRVEEWGGMRGSEEKGGGQLRWEGI